MLLYAPDYELAFGLTLFNRMLILIRGLRNFAGKITKHLADGDNAIPVLVGLAQQFSAEVVLCPIHRNNLETTGSTVKSR